MVVSYNGVAYHVKRTADDVTPETAGDTATTMSAWYRPDGTLDLFVANHGRFPVRLPDTMTTRAAIIAADGTGAYQLSRRTGPTTYVLRKDVWPWLSPGHKISAGWLRVTDPDARIQWDQSP